MAENAEWARIASDVIFKRRKPPLRDRESDQEGLLSFARSHSLFRY
jgi:hypothetical protein